MRNIKYKAISKDLEILAKPSMNPGRVSIGLEQNIGEYFYIQIENLIPYHKQARQIFDQESIIALSDTIKEHGIRQPLTVLPQENNAGKYEIISGERRYRAAKLAGLEKIPCIIIYDKKAAAEISLIENIQREDLHIIELGEAILELLDPAVHFSKRELARKLGLPKTTFFEAIQAAHLNKDIKEKLLNNKIVNRDFLRSIVQTKDQAEQKRMLENFINKMQKKKAHKIHKKKVIATVTLEHGEIKISLKGMDLLTANQKLFIKNRFIEELSDQGVRNCGHLDERS